MAHEHSVYDGDTHFKINPITRQIENTTGKVILMQNDHNSERFTFETPRLIDGHDMSLCNKVEVHYINIDAKDKSQNSGVYPIEDLQISPNSEDVVICSWLISQNATKFAGTLNFVLRYACLTGTTIDYQWFTDIHKGISVSESISNGEYIATEYADILEQWKEELLSEGVGGVSDYNELQNKPIERIESLDTENLVNLRDLESGQYILYGYFSPYANSDISISADNSMVSVIKKVAGSHIICLDPLNAKIVFFEILVDETAEKGFNYTRTIVPVLDVYALIEKVGELSELTTEEKNSLVGAINEVAQNSGAGVKSINGATPDENGNVEIEAGGLSTTASELLIKILRGGVYSEDQSSNIDALAVELGVTEEEPDEPEVTLSSISVTYSGGDVAVGTAVTDLTGIVVTAWYSDGSTATIADYTLSGEIVEGSNTITVSYGGKTATFTVTGVAENTGGGETEGVAVAMTKQLSNENVSMTWYSDGGSTTATDCPSKNYFGILVSDNVFSEDTEVTIKIADSARLFDCWNVGCFDFTADGSFDSGDSVYYAIHVGTNTWANSGATYEFNYTVKAGYNLIITAYGDFNDTATVTVEVV